MINRLALVMALLLAGYGMAAQAGDDPGPFQPSWDSLKQHATPVWYQDAKFGIFIHWGVYCVPAFGNEWYPRNMYKDKTPEFAYHRARYGDQNAFGYKDFIPMFTADRFDAAQWAALFKNAGARFVVPVAEHHDGFAMYDSGLSNWTAAKMGPKRDVIGELAKAVRDAGIVFGVSSHRAEHWWFYDQGMTFDSDVKAGQQQDFYGPAQPEKGSTPDEAFLKDWLGRCTELVDKYQPQLFWFDWWIEQPVFQPYLQQFAAHYYNQGAAWGKEVAINYKNETFPPQTAVLDIERGKLDALRDQFWQTDTSISIKSWGYIEGDTFRSVNSLVDDLVDIVSKNGCLLLNVGPKADGTFPKEAEGILLGIGDWLSVNGEAIYGTRPWKVFGEGPTKVKTGSFTDTRNAAFKAEDIRFTQKDGVIYAICLAWPAKALKIQSITPDAAQVASVSMLGSDEAMMWTQAADGLTLSRPLNRPCEHAYTFKIGLK